jgi:hypothetical protein
MRTGLCIVFSVLGLSLFSQSKKPDKLKQIAAADTVVFSVETSGCIESGVLIYKLARQKNKDRLVMYTIRGVAHKKKLSAKNYDVFTYRFRSSAQRFKYLDEETKTCTMQSTFELSDKKQKIDFRNTTCEAEFNPEELLKQLMK